MEKRNGWSVSPFRTYLRRSPIFKANPDQTRLADVERRIADGEQTVAEAYVYAMRPTVVGASTTTTTRGSAGATVATGARVRDAIAGVTYEVTVSEGLISSVTILPDVGVDLASRRPALPLRALLREAADQNGSPVPAFKLNAPRTEIEHVAAVALAAEAAGRSMRKTIAGELGISPNTADGLLRRARELKLIPPARTGRKRKESP